MQPFEATPGEKRWFLVYAPAAFVARMLMLFGIALVVASKFFLIGVLIALWSLWTGIGLPLWKMVAHVLPSPQLHRNRAYAARMRSEEHTSELQSLMRISYAVLCLKNKTKH